MERLREDKKKAVEAKNQAISERQKLAGELCEEGMEQVLEKYSGLEGRMKSLLSRTLKLVLGSQAPQDL